MLFTRVQVDCLIFKFQLKTIPPPPKPTKELTVNGLLTKPVSSRVTEDAQNNPMTNKLTNRQVSRICLSLCHSINQCSQIVSSLPDDSIHRIRSDC